MTRSKWMRLLFAAFAMFALVAVAACGDDDDDDDTGDDGSEPTADSGEPTEGGEITVAYLEHETFDPHFSSFAQDIGVQGMVWRGLYNLAKDNTVIPEMAADLPEISEDGLTYTIKIKDGLTWSDGDDLLAEDFAAGILRTCSPLVGGDYYFVLANIAGCDAYWTATEATADEQAALREEVAVQAVDDTTLEITLLNPQPTFTTILYMWVAYPVPVHVLEDIEGEWPAVAENAYNGPFQVESYTAGDSIVLTKNPNYGGAHLAYLDKITLRYIDDLEVANNAYRSDEVSIAAANIANLAGLQTEYPDELLSQAAATTRGLQMNMDVEPLDNLQVRLAISKAIDRENLNAIAAQGGNIPTTTWIPGDVVGGGVDTNTFDEQVGYDPEGAAALLAEAGYPGGEGFPTDFRITVGDTPSAIATGEFLQQNLLDVLGIQTELVVLDSPGRSAAFREEDFEFFPGGWNQDYPDPENWVVGLFDTDGGLNHYNCSDPEIDQLIEDALFNTNDEERREQYRRVNEIISTTICGIANYWHEGNHTLIKPNLGGVVENGDSKDRVVTGDWIVEEWFLKAE